jgi:hypothetical protein
LTEGTLGRVPFFFFYLHIMFDATEVKQQFVGLVGFRQNDNPDFEQLASNLLYTGSNILVDHPLCSIENIDAIARNQNKYNYPTYVALTTYAAETPQSLVRVKYNSKVYRSLQGANTGNTPDTSPLFWELVPLLSAYLEDVIQSANLDAVVETFNTKKIAMQVKSLLMNQRLYEGSGALTDRVINDGSLVGLMIEMKYTNNIVAIIEKIGLQLTQAQAITMRLYHSSQEDAIATVSLNHVKAISFQWHVTTTLRMHYMNPDYESGGCFFLMYDQNDLVGQAVQKRHDFMKVCGSCSGFNTEALGLFSKYLTIQAVKVPSAARNPDANGVKLWDITKTQIVTDTNFGLNLEVSARCDLTKMLVQQKDLFQYAVRDQVIFRLLKDMANSTRMNTTHTKVDVLARAELQAPIAGGGGFMTRLDRTMKAIDMDISNLSDTCMPCARKKGLSIGTAGLANGSH